jgi:protoporphyrinogen oxidase
MTVYILGGGPAGLALADGLAEAGQPFVLLEQSQRLGGLARTEEWAGVGSHDLGPHKLFTLDAVLMARVQALLPPDSWLVRDKKSSIFMGGYFLPYPPSPFSLRRVFGLRRFLGMTAGYGVAMLRRMLPGRKTPQSFEADLVDRMGRGLYEALFAPIALKLWGPPAELDVKLSRGRVQTPSLLETLALVLGRRRSSSFEALTFVYPKGGLGRLWEAIQARSEPKGRFLLGHGVAGFELNASRISAIRCNGPLGEVRFEVGPEDFVVSTLPVMLTVRLLGPELSKETLELAQKSVALNDLVLVFLHVDRPKLFAESWVFIPDPGVDMHRVSEQASFDPGMASDGSIVCCEIMSRADRDRMSLPDEQLVAGVVAGLASMGRTGFQVRESRVIRLPKSYPVFKRGYEPALAQLMQELDRFENFRSIGRQGAFNYIGTLDAMDIGYGMSRWLAGDRSQAWSDERERTAHYPVLD